MRLMSTGNLPSPLCSPTLGAPIILSPSQTTPRTPIQTHMMPSTSMAAALSGLVSGSLQPSTLMTPIDYTGQLFLKYVYMDYYKYTPFLICFLAHSILRLLVLFQQVVINMLRQQQPCLAFLFWVPNIKQQWIFLKLVDRVELL